MFNMFQKPKTNNSQQITPPDDQIYLDLEIYVLYDSKVGTYRLPSFQASKWDVIRNLEQMFEDPQQAQKQAEDLAIKKARLALNRDKFDFSKTVKETTPTYAFEELGRTILGDGQDVPHY